MEINILASSSDGNCIILFDGTGYIMLDCGISLKDMRSHGQYIFSEFDKVLVTHEHGDHTKGFKALLDIGCSFAMSNGTKESICRSECLNIDITKHMQWIETDNFKIMPFDVKHDAAEPLGFLIISKNTSEKVLFVTDSYMIPVRFKGIDYYLVECNYKIDILMHNIENRLSKMPKNVFNRIVQSHMEFDVLKEYLIRCDLTKTKAIYLIHLSSGNSNEQYFINEIQNATGKVVYCG